MRIGIVDYYLSEWHANNYPAWLLKASEVLGIEATVTVAWAEKEISPVDGVSTDEWCQKQGVARAESLEALCRDCDAIMVLAPSDPEKHLEYAKVVLPFGKPTFIDKTFAPNLGEARQIVALAEQYGTPMFSSSALRFADELESLKGSRGLIFTAGGSNLPEYLIHPLEMAVKTLDEPIDHVWVERQGKQYLLGAETASGARVTVVFAQKLPYTVAAEDATGSASYAAIRSDFFGGLMRAILQFFETKIPPVKADETLQIMQLRDALLAEAARKNQ